MLVPPLLHGYGDSQLGDYMMSVPVRSISFQKKHFFSENDEDNKRF